MADDKKNDKAQDKGAMLPQSHEEPADFMQQNPDEPNSGAAATDVASGLMAPTHDAGDFAPVESASAPKESKADASGKAKLAKLAGVKVEDVDGYNAERNTITTVQGQKFRLAADQKSMVRLSGPAVEA